MAKLAKLTAQCEVKRWLKLQYSRGREVILNNQMKLAIKSIQH
jgi:hypothetical protein